MSTPIPLVETKSLFLALLKRLECDLVLDIGSRDGRQALLFRDVLPHAPVVAFEANPYNFRKMAAQTVFNERQIRLCPAAVSDQDGRATFHISQADYNAPETDANNLGTSSLLLHPEVPVLEKIEVDTVRLESFLADPLYVGCRRLALWIDVEGAEYYVLQGLGNAASRVQLIHVETAREPVRLGQKAREDVRHLLQGWRFVEIGTNMTADAVWGDWVWVTEATLQQQPAALRAAVRQARWHHRLRISAWAVRLKRLPWLYRLLRRAVIRGI